MRVFLDSSVIVAASVESHPAHERALPWLQRIKSGADTGVVAAHSIAEVYASLTKPKFRPTITPAVARQAIQENILSCCRVVALSAADYADLLDHLTATNITGGTIYDALLLHAAASAGVDQIVTLNAKHFRRVYPPLSGLIVEP